MQKIVLKSAETLHDFNKNWFTCPNVIISAWEKNVRKIKIRASTSKMCSLMKKIVVYANTMRIIVKVSHVMGNRYKALKMPEDKNFICVFKINANAWINITIAEIKHIYGII